MARFSVHALNFQTEPSPIRQRMAAWNLPDFLVVDIYLRLRDELGQHPPQYLRPIPGSIGGMEYRFAVVDPEDRLCEHVCVFLVMFSQDEESLEVVGFQYERHLGN